MVTKRYYLIDPTSDIAKAYNDWHQQVISIRKAKRKYFKDLGVKESYEWDDGRTACVSFKKGVEVPKGFMPDKNHEGYYKPDRRTKVGKEISKKLSSFEEPKYDDAKELLKHQDFIAGAGGRGGLAMYSAVLWKNVEDIIVASVPIKEGGSYDPQPGMTEILASEWEKIRDAVIPEEADAKV